MKNSPRNDRVWRILLIMVVVAAHAVPSALGAGRQTQNADETEGTGYEVYGVVVTADGEAFPGAIVALSGKGSDQKTVSDMEGAFRLTAVPPGEYAVTFTATGRKKVKLKITVAGDDVDMGQITLE
jgi:hypothetical protein